MPQADVDSTISALQGGLTSVPAEAAVSVIESWQEQLQGAAPEIASTLGQLKSGLVSGTADAATVSSLLSKLGSDTSAAGASAGGDAGSKLQELGALLTQAGASLA